MFKKSIIAMAVAATSCGVFAADQVDWEAAKSSDHVVNVNGDQINGVAALDVFTDDVVNEDSVYSSGKNIQSGATSSFGILARGESSVTNEGAIYVDGQGGYTAGLATMYGSSSIVINGEGGVIYVNGSGANTKAKGISVDDGGAINKGKIVVWGGSAIVANTQGNPDLNSIENAGVVEVHTGFGLVDNKGAAGQANGVGVSMTNSGSILVDGENSAAVLIGSDSKTGTTTFKNTGLLAGTNGASAIAVFATDHTVDLTLAEGSKVEGLVYIADKNGLNQTNLNLSEITNEDIQLEAKYLNNLSLENSDVTVSTASDEATLTKVKSMTTSGSKFRMSGDRSLTVDNLSGSNASFEFDSFATAGKNLSIGQNDVESTKVTFTANAVDNFAPEEIAEVMNGAVDLNVADGNTGSLNGYGTNFTASVDAVTGEMAVEASDLTQSTVDMAVASAVAWRNEITTLNDRMSTLRTSPSQYGAWARYNGGEYKYDDRHMDNQFNTIEVGGDARIGNSPWTVGASFAYTQGEGDFVNGSTESDTYSGALYAMWNHEGGSFVDMVAKVGSLKSDYDFYNLVGGAFDKGSLDRTGYIFGIETGHRFTVSDSFYVEPQLQLVYSSLSSESETTAHRTIDVDTTDSLVGRIGVMAGMNYAMGSAYVRVSGLRDFTGEVDGSFTTNGNTYKMSQDMDDSWVEFAIGTNLKVSDNFYVFADVQKSTGGDIDLDWRANVGAKLFF